MLNNVNQNKKNNYNKNSQIKNNNFSDNNSNYNINNNNKRYSNNDYNKSHQINYSINISKNKFNNNKTSLCDSIISKQGNNIKDDNKKELSNIAINPNYSYKNNNIIQNNLNINDE